MKPQTKNSCSKNWAIWIASLCLVGIYACGGSQALSTVNKPTTKAKRGTILLENQSIYKDETYAKIEGSLARLRAMMCGRFVQHKCNIQEDGTVLRGESWTVNDGEDSVVTYVIPVGDYRKIGYWMYYAQCLTSLPNEPVYSVFYKMSKVDRDTIRVTHYRVPKGFKLEINNMLKDPDAAFGIIDVDTLVPNSYMTDYIRQSPIKYVGETNRLEAHEKEGEAHIKYKKFFFEVEPKQVHFGYILYDTTEKRLGRDNKSSMLVRTAMVHPDHLH